MDPSSQGEKGNYDQLTLASDDCLLETHYYFNKKKHAPA